MSTKPTPPPIQAFNDVLARMMQAEENEGGPPPATPCDTPVEVISQIHMTVPENAPPGNEGTVQMTRQEFENTPVLLKEVFMLLQRRPILRPRIRCLAALASIWSLGVAFARPPDRTPSPDEPVVQGKDEIWLIAADDLGVQIQQLEQHLAWMRKWATFRKDPDTVAAVESLQKKLVVARENHRELCRLCEERLHDTLDALACCQKIDDVMHEVIEEHVALMRRLNARRKHRHK